MSNDSVNGNGRIYPRQVIEDAIAEVASQLLRDGDVFVRASRAELEERASYNLPVQLDHSNIVAGCPRHPVHNDQDCTRCRKLMRKQDHVFRMRMADITLENARRVLGEIIRGIAEDIVDENIVGARTQRVVMRIARSIGMPNPKSSEHYARCYASRRST